MTDFNRQSIVQMKNELEVDLIGVVRIDDSTPEEIRDPAESLLPAVKSVVVFAKEIYKEIIDLPLDRLLDLVSLGIDPLVEIAFLIQEGHCDCRETNVCKSLECVSCKYA